MILTGKTTKNRKMEGRLLAKLIFNHFSYLTIISLFDLDWKEPVFSFFFYVREYLNSSPQSIFVLDCVFITDSNTRFKLNFYYLCSLPVISGFLYLGFFFIFKYTRSYLRIIYLKFNHIKKTNTASKSYNLDFQDLKAETVATFTIINLNFYSSILINLTDIINCVELNEGEYHLRKNLNIICWSSEHKIYLAISSVFIIIWGLGVPYTFFRRSRNFIKIIPLNSPKGYPIESSIFDKYLADASSRGNSSNKSTNLSKFIIYGYSPRFYFWESVMFAKKALIIFLSRGLVFLDKRSMTAFMILIFTAFYYVNERWTVYSSQEIKRFESLSLIISIITLGLGLFASIVEMEKFMKFVSLLVIISANAFFFTMALKEYILIKIDSILKTIKGGRIGTKSEVNRKFKFDKKKELVL